MIASEAHTGWVDWAAWKRLFLAYNFVMLGLAVPVVVYGYGEVHRYLPTYAGELSFSWSLSSVVACLEVGVAANLVLLLGPLAELGLARLAKRRLGRTLRNATFLIWLAASILALAYIGFAFWTLPIALIG